MDGRSLAVGRPRRRPSPLLDRSSQPSSEFSAISPTCGREDSGRLLGHLNSPSLPEERGRNEVSQAKHSSSGSSLVGRGARSHDFTLSSWVAPVERCPLLRFEPSPSGSCVRRVSSSHCCDLAPQSLVGEHTLFATSLSFAYQRVSATSGLLGCGDRHYSPFVDGFQAYFTL